MQIALSIKYNAFDGSVDLTELNKYLSDGWKVILTDVTGFTVIVILETL